MWQMTIDEEAPFHSKGMVDQRQETSDDAPGLTRKDGCVLTQQFC